MCALREGALGFEREEGRERKGMCALCALREGALGFEREEGKEGEGGR